jgi:hypothetical protein
MDLGKCYVARVDIGPRHREVDPAKAKALAESIKEIGLRMPISVWAPDEYTLQLVTGLHRLEAAKLLGWEEIDCEYVDLDEIGRKLWEVDENLCRAELTAEERRQHVRMHADLSVRKVIKETEKEGISVTVSEIPPKRKLHRKVPGGPKRGRPSKNAAMVKELAAKTGKSERTIQRDLQEPPAAPAAPKHAGGAASATLDDAEIERLHGLVLRLSAPAGYPLSREEIQKTIDILRDPIRRDYVLRCLETVLPEARSEAAA